MNESLADAELRTKSQLHMAVIPWFALVLLTVFGVLVMHEDDDYKDAEQVAAMWNNREQPK